MNTDTQINRTQVECDLAATVVTLTGSAPPVTPSSPVEEFVIGIDVSGSMAGPFTGAASKLDAGTTAARNVFIDRTHLDANDRGGLLSFTGKARTETAVQTLRTGRREVLMALQRLSPGGTTNIDSALRHAQAMLDWTFTDVTRRICLVTDGYGGHPQRTTQKLKDLGVIIDVIGIGDSERNVNERMLRSVASTVHGESRYVFVRDMASLLTHADTTITCKVVPTGNYSQGASR